MIHAKIDVKLHSHPKARKAGSAMATWAWALCYIRDHETDGFVSDAAIGAAWPGESQARKDAARLVAVGLWEVVPEGEGPEGDSGWRLCKYADKNETREQIDARRAEDRGRKRASSVRNPIGIQSDSTRTHSESVVGIPGSGSGSGSDLESRSREPDPARATPDERPSRPHNDAPPCAEPTSLVAVPDAMGSPPAWWDAVIATLHASTGVLVPSGPCWLSYAGHRASKGRPAERSDALYWLNQVKVPEERERLRREARDRDRDAKFDARHAPPQVAAPPSHRIVTRDHITRPTDAELAEVRRLAAKGLPFLVDPTGTDE